MKNTIKRDKIGNAEQNEEHHEPENNDGTSNNVDQASPDEAEISNDDKQAIPEHLAALLKYATVALKIGKGEFLAAATDVRGWLTKLKALADHMEGIGPGEDWDITFPDEDLEAFNGALVMVPEALKSVREALDTAVVTNEAFYYLPEIINRYPEICDAMMGMPHELGEEVTDTWNMAEETTEAVLWARGSTFDTLRTAASLLLAIADYGDES